MPGFVELLFIIVILVIVFGFRRLPDLGEALGRAIYNLKSGSRSRGDIEVDAVQPHDQSKPRGG